MKYIFLPILLFIILSSFLFSCNKENVTSPKYEINDSILGMFGYVKIYDQFGDTNTSIGVIVEALRYKTMEKVDVNETITTETDANGGYRFIDCKGGYYNIVFRKDGFAENRIYSFNHDTIYADTLETVILSQAPPATIEITNITTDSVKFDITRVIHFTGSSSEEYPILSRYFIDTLPTVSKDRYVSQFITGVSYGSSGSQNELTISKTINYILSEAVLDAGDTIYICAYPDNIKPCEYTIPGEDEADDRQYFLSLGQKSNTVYFIVDSLMLPDYSF